MDFDFEKPLQPLRDKIDALVAKSRRGDPTAEAALAGLRKQLAKESASLYARLTPWETVQVARHPGRPTARQYAEKMCDEFVELHGDRVCADDPAILGGLARIGKTRFLLLGHQKGTTTEERIACRFGMANPDGYRKADRLMRLAEKWGLPVVTLVDTAGAYPGLEAEARGQGEAIGRSLLVMAGLKTPILSIVTGEGGSGGALGIALGDRVLMLQFAVYSVISPEGCASILWRDGAKAPEAAAALKITAKDLLRLGVVDGIVPEPEGAAHANPDRAIALVRKAILDNLADMMANAPVGDRLVEERFRKFSAMGKFDPKKAVKA